MFRETHSSKTEENENLGLESLFWTEEYPIEFNHLAVTIKPGFHSIALSSGTIIGTKYTFRKINYRGVQLTIAGRDDSLRTRYTEYRALNLYLIKDSGYVELTIEIKEHPDFGTVIFAERSIVRHDSKRTLPNGIGRIFTFQADVVLQQLANSTDKIVLERIDRNPGYDGVELSGQEWDRMFITELEKRGYTRTSDNTFSKEFHPE